MRVTLQPFFHVAGKVSKKFEQKVRGLRGENTKNHLSYGTRGALQITLDSEIHPVRMQPVLPTRTTGVNSNPPKDSP
jgi:hypothetical protein